MMIQLKFILEHAAEIIIVAAGIITAANGVLLYTTDKRREEVKAELEKYMNSLKLKDYEKRIMCNSYCKYKDQAESAEDIAWKCASCPIKDL